MTIKDRFGHILSGATAKARDHYEDSLAALRCYIGDPVASVDQALAECPNFAMAHGLRAWLHLLGTEPGALPLARESWRAAQQYAVTAQEKGHAQAVGHLVARQWHAAGRVLEAVTADHPLDGLALQAGHQIDFFTGNAQMLRDRIGRVLPFWSEAMPGYHALLGMHAFGLEETGDYEEAERKGRRAVAMEPRDGWAQHAVAHVMEMQGRLDDGVDWMSTDPEVWSRESFFAVHNWWHLALYRLERNEIDEVLALFDGPIYGKRSNVVLDMIDASALLWRLHLRGVDVKKRFALVADNWRPIATAGNYAFNDVHAVMAFVGAGRPDDIAAVFESQSRAMTEAGDNASFTREVGFPVAQAIEAFGKGNYKQVIRLLQPVRAIAHHFGGSHAQRDVLSLTLLEAAARAKDFELANALTRERLASRPTSPFARLLANYATRAGAA